MSCQPSPKSKERSHWAFFNVAHGCRTGNECCMGPREISNIYIYISPSNIYIPIQYISPPNQYPDPVCIPISPSNLALPPPPRRACRHIVRCSVFGLSEQMFGHNLNRYSGFCRLCELLFLWNERCLLQALMSRSLMILYQYVCQTFQWYLQTETKWSRLQKCHNYTEWPEKMQRRRA